MRLLACLFSRSLSAVRVTQTIDPRVLLLERDNPQQGIALDFDQLDFLTELYNEIRASDCANLTPPQETPTHRPEDGFGSIWDHALGREDT